MLGLALTLQNFTPCFDAVPHQRLHHTPKLQSRPLSSRAPSCRRPGSKTGNEKSRNRAPDVSRLTEIPERGRLSHRFPFKRHNEGCGLACSQARIYSQLTLVWVSEMEQPLEPLPLACVCDPRRERLGGQGAKSGVDLTQSSRLLE